MLSATTNNGKKVQGFLIVEEITTPNKSNVGAVMGHIYTETSLIILTEKWLP